MAGIKSEESYFLRELYTPAAGQATKVLRGEKLARRLGMELEGETDKARCWGTAP